MTDHTFQYDTSPDTLTTATAPDPLEQARETLRRSGLSATRNRVRVLAVLRSSEQPLSAKAVHAATSKEHKLNQATVYRILDLFAEHDVATRISSGEGDFRYCARPGRDLHGHCHFHCVQCGRVHCLSIPLSIKTLDLSELADSTTMPEVHGMELRIDGLCAECRNRQSNI